MYKIAKERFYSIDLFIRENMNYLEKEIAK